MLRDIGYTMPTIHNIYFSSESGEKYAQSTVY